MCFLSNVLRWPALLVIHSTTVKMNVQTEGIHTQSLEEQTIAYLFMRFAEDVRIPSVLGFNLNSTNDARDTTQLIVPRIKQHKT